MDLNHLFHRHQMSLLAAARETSPEARCSHLGLVAGYAEHIAALQGARGALSPMRRMAG